jgi:hypothetical protein
MSDIAQAIENTLERYRDCWSRLDFDELRGLWDTDEPAPLYIPEESSAALFEWPQIDAYWAATRKATRSIRIETWNLVVRELPEGLASACYDMRWSGEFTGYARPIGGELRVSALFRARPGGWRFIHYVEAPLAPIAYFKRSYERFAQAPPPKDTQ